MNKTENKKLTYEKDMINYNSWCKQFKVASRWIKNGIRFYYPDEFDVNKFKKLIETKTWKTF